MQLQEQAHALLWRAGQEPYLPQGPSRIQPSPRQLRAGQQQLCLITGSGQRVDADVVGEVKGGRVDPQGPAQPTAGPVQALPEARDKVQSGLELPADRLDAEATVVVQQAGAVEDGERADVAGPAEVVPQEQEEVRCAQAFQWACLGHDVTLLFGRSFATHLPLGGLRDHGQRSLPSADSMPTSLKPASRGAALEADPSVCQSWRGPAGWHGGGPWSWCPLHRSPTGGRPAWLAQVARSGKLGARPVRCPNTLRRRRGRAARGRDAW